MHVFGSHFGPHLNLKLYQFIIMSVQRVILKYNLIDINSHQILKQNWLSKYLAAILDSILNSDVISLIRLLQKVDLLSTDLDDYFGILKRMFTIESRFNSN